MAGLAVTDHDGSTAPSGSPGSPGSSACLGVRRRADARLAPLAAGVVGQSGVPDPEGHLSCWRGRVGYARLARAVSEAQMRGSKGEPRLSLEELAEASRAPAHLRPDPALHNDSWFVLTGCRKGTVPRALVDRGPAAAERELHRLVDAFGKDRVLVECGITATRSTVPQRRTGHLAAPPASLSWPPHVPSPRRRNGRGHGPGAIRARRSLAPSMAGSRPPGAHLRSPAEQTAASPLPGAVERTVEIAASAPSTSTWSPPACPTSPSRPATTR